MKKKSKTKIDNWNYSGVLGVIVAVTLIFMWVLHFLYTTQLKYSKYTETFNESGTYQYDENNTLVKISPPPKYTRHGDELSSPIFINVYNWSVKHFNNTINQSWNISVIRKQLFECNITYSYYDHYFILKDTGSMFYEKGTGFYCNRVDEIADLDIMDIIVFKPTEYETVGHRIINITGNRIITKGDANNIADKPITFDQVVCKVVRIDMRR